MRANLNQPAYTHIHQSVTRTRLAKPKFLLMTIANNNLLVVDDVLYHFLQMSPYKTRVSCFKKYKHRKTESTHPSFKWSHLKYDLEHTAGLLRVFFLHNVTEVHL